MTKLFLSGFVKLQTSPLVADESLFTVHQSWSSMPENDLCALHWHHVLSSFEVSLFNLQLHLKTEPKNNKSIWSKHVFTFLLNLKLCMYVISAVYPYMCMNKPSHKQVYHSGIFGIDQKIFDLFSLIANWCHFKLIKDSRKGSSRPVLE